MQIELNGSTLSIRTMTSSEYAEISSWGKMRWDRKSQSLRGTADLELLDKLKGRLPAEIEAYRRGLHAVRNAVNREREKENPEPLYNYPVKVPLYAHQVRGANMALLTFGWIPAT